MPDDVDSYQLLSSYEPADLLDGLSTGIVTLDPQLCLVYANVSAQDLMRISVRAARGRSFAPLFHDSERLGRMLKRAMERLEPCAQHEMVLQPLGAPLPREPQFVDIIITPLEGQLTGTHLLLELTDARSRRRLSRDNDLLSGIDGSRLMVRQLAHEIKNPLGGLRGAAQLLERELHDPALREYTSVIIGEADRLTALVDSMTSPSRPPQKSALNIHEICEHVVRLLRAEAADGVRIERDYDPSLPEGLFDRNQLIQALLNVGRNALQALEGNGRIVLRTRVQTNVNIGAVRHRLVATVQIEDNGKGVPPELAKTLFYPLVTGRSTGTGLGLAVAQDLISRHGGLIEFDSEPGRTLFTLLLPLEVAS